MAAWSGLFNGVHATDYSLLVNHAPHLKPVNKLFRKSRYGSRGAAALLNALIGAAIGNNVAATLNRVAASADPGNPIVNGGAISIETRTLLNRNTTADDVTMLKAIFADSSKPTYPIDKSGNGGGGQLTKQYSMGA